MNADRLTERSQEALSSAVSRATADGSPLVDPLHLLVALLDAPEGVAPALLEATGTPVAQVRARADTALERLPHASGARVSPPQFSRQFVAVLNDAERQAGRIGD